MLLSEIFRITDMKYAEELKVFQKNTIWFLVLLDDYQDRKLMFDYILKDNKFYL